MVRALIGHIMAARQPAKILGVADTATADGARSAFLALSQQIHPDHCSHPDAARAFAKLVTAHERFRPLSNSSGTEFDPSVAEFQGDALTTAGWVYDEAARATLRHRDSRTLGSTSKDRPRTDLTSTMA